MRPTFIDFSLIEDDEWYADLDGTYHFADGRIGVWSSTLRMIVVLNTEIQP